jgi:hypothetical protein
MTWAEVCNELKLNSAVVKLGNTGECYLHCAVRQASDGDLYLCCI